MRPTKKPTARADRTAELRRRLLRWYARAKRDLPWRRARSPYRIWVAETMLQQTQVRTVLPYYRRFLRRFPSAKALAEAPLDAVLAVWAGLGYYGRARNLHRAAKEVRARHRGRIPRDRDGLLALPGVGRYTAGAVLSIAFNRPEPVVDGNVARVLCRLFAVDSDPAAGRTQTRLWTLAHALIAPRRPGDFNQAMMELGSLVCTSKEPACPRCPVATLCEAFREGRQLDLPRTRRRKRTPHYDVAVALLWRSGKLLITKRPPDGMLGGLWEFPGGKRRDGEPLAAAVAREVREETGLVVSVGEGLPPVKHAYSHFRVTLHAFHCKVIGGRLRAASRDGHAWVAPGELAAYPFPSGSRKIIEQLRQAGGRSAFASPPRAGSSGSRARGR